MRTSGVLRTDPERAPIVHRIIHDSPTRALGSVPAELS